MSRPIQIGSGGHSHLQHQNSHQEIRRSESFGNFTPSSWGKPYHQTEMYASSPTSRSRTISTSSETIHQGIIKKFSRTKGHGFIQQVYKNDESRNSTSNAPNSNFNTPTGPTPPQPKIAQPMVYFHVSDIQGNLVPKENDECSFRIAFLPPRDNEKAIEVKLLLSGEQEKQHDTWQKSNN